MDSKRPLVRATLWLALIGATVGPMLDGLHTFSGATLLTLCFVGAWLAWDRTPLGIACAVAAGAAGWLVEHTLVGEGLFFHRETTLDGLALWLPPLYFSAALAIGALARKLSAPL